MKITEDVWKYATEHKISENEALEVGFKEKAQELFKEGAEICAKAKRDR